MTSHSQRRTVPVPATTIFDLVADVERYPDFLSLWRRARVYAREENGYFTEQEIGLGPIRERFRTHTRLSRPDYIDITSIDPLFKTFRIRWDFSSIRDGAGVDVTIAMTWEVSSRLLQKGIEAMLPATATRMVSAFEERARAVHRRTRIGPGMRSDRD
ncbi:MAG: type II toxin-antitoxin system RatA family toxin [Rhodospirillales bacterium]